MLREGNIKRAMIDLIVPSPPENTMGWPNVVLMLDKRRRRWSNIKTTLGQRLVFAGLQDRLMAAAILPSAKIKSFSIVMIPHRLSAGLSSVDDQLDVDGSG